jgi:hypothetical protein
VSRIRYDGTPAGAEKIRAAVAAIKSKQTIHARRGGDRLELDQEWPDGQVIPNRWTLRVGDHLDTATGAVVDAP